MSNDSQTSEKHWILAMNRVYRLWKQVAKVTVVGLAALTLTTVVTGTAKAQAPTLKLKETNKVEANGDAAFKYEIKLPTALYTMLKKNTPNTALLLRKLGLHQENWFLVDDIKGNWDDGASTVVIECKTRGAARMGKDQNWEIPLAEGSDLELVAVQDGVAILTSAAAVPGFGVATCTTRVALPAGAKDVKPLTNPARLAYKLPASEAGGEPKAEFEAEAKPKVMSALAKPMSQKKFSALWTARSIFKNSGTQTLTDYRVRFKMTDFTNAWSPWSGTPKVVPGQTVVDPYFPIMDMEKIGKLTGNTRASVEVQYQYKTADGKLHEDSETKELQLMSRNEVFFTSMAAGESVDWSDMDNMSPFILPAFVTHEDPIIQQAVGWVTKAAGGINAAGSDEEALKFMAAVYEFMGANIAYQTPPWEGNGNKMVQHVKFGRDILRNRAGTCIDLAILYGSMCEAVGLEPVLFSIPGHCFPAVILPKSGRLIPVESTMIGKASFDDANKYAYEKHIKSINAGTLSSTKVEISKLHKEGVHPIDLPNLPGDSLEKWGVKAEFAKVKKAENNENRPNDNRLQPQQPPAQPAQKISIVGDWATSAMNNGVQIVQLIGFMDNGGFAMVAEASTGQRVAQKGTWELNGNKITLNFENNMIEKGSIEWVNKDQFKYTGPSGIAMTYQRQPK